MISLCMIVKNEVNVLEKCIASVQNTLKNTVNEMIVVDTGSTDGTRELAEKLGCTVYDFEWVNDFSKARNFSISKAKNDWILHLDADEYIISADEQELKVLCTKKYENTRGFIKLDNIDTSGVVVSASRLARIFNRRIYEFKNSIHETIVPKRPCDIQNYNLKMVVEHTGYQEEVYEEKDKVERNKVMILEYLNQNPDDLYMLGQLAIMYKAEGNSEKALETFEKVVFNQNCVNEEYYTMMVCEYLKLLLKLNMNLAATICENLWSYCKDNDEYMYYMAIAFAREGMIEKSVDTLLMCINKAGETNIDKKFPYSMLATIYEQTGYTEDAIECYKHCGDEPETLEKIKVLEAKLNN